MNETLLTLRDKMKSKKPTFLRQDVRKKDSLKDKWRNPKGYHSKLRRKFRGTRPFPSMGYRSPAAVRGLTPEGFIGTIVNNVSDLAKVKDKAAVIASNVGARKTITILDEAKKAGIKILNVKDPEAFKKETNEMIAANKAKQKAKKTKKEVAKPKQEEKKKETITQEEQKKMETQEKKKIIEGK